MTLQKGLSVQTYFSLATLLVFNFIAVVGVLFWGWSSAFLLFTYWLESLAIGFFNLLKMKNAAELGDKKRLKGYTSNGKVPSKGKWWIILFFVSHYGVFMVVHLAFLLIFIFGGVGGLERPDNLGMFFGQSFVFFIGVSVSHLVSYKVNYIGNEEYKKSNVVEMFGIPYKRIVPIHLAILFGAMFGFPALVLIGLKTIIDVLGHLGERKRFRKTR
jgi:hypothetical protein